MATIAGFNNAPLFDALRARSEMWRASEDIIGAPRFRALVEHLFTTRADDAPSDIADIVALPIVKRYRERTRRDLVESIIGARAIGETVRDIEARRNAAGESFDPANNAMDLAEARARLSQALDEAANEANAIADAVADFGEQGDDDASGDASERNDGNGAAGGGGAGRRDTPEEYRAASAARRMAIAETLRSPTFQRVADAFGRLADAIDSACDEKRETDGRLFKSERDRSARLDDISDDALALDDDEFYDALANARIETDVKRDEERIGLGPMLMLLDKSGSMQASINAFGRSMTRDDIASAVALATARRCRRQRRRMRVAQFEYGIGDAIDIDPTRSTNISRLADVVGAAPGGGTNIAGTIDQALASVAALRDADADDADFAKRADIVIVTDACDALGAKSVAALADSLADKDAPRLHTIFIGDAATAEQSDEYDAERAKDDADSGWQGARHAFGVLREQSASFIALDSLDTPDAVERLAAIIAESMNDAGAEE